ncbi:hypothetical protein FACS1894198_1350 [Clostridia bacterium]|nr:hypothetical protein FACS1894198_1350 [Clostridia bacterium]
MALQPMVHRQVQSRQALLQSLAEASPSAQRSKPLLQWGEELCERIMLESIRRRQLEREGPALVAATDAQNET